IGLGDAELVEIDAELAGVDGVEGMFGVDEGRRAALALGFRRHMEGERGLARAFRAEHLDAAAARQAADAEGDVETEGARGNDLRRLHRTALAHAHHGALAERPLDLTESRVQSLVLVHVVLPNQSEISSRHWRPSLFHSPYADAMPAICTPFVPIAQ